MKPAKKNLLSPLSTKDNDRLCLLHIGAPKTGSTALEKFLTHNCDVLKHYGWVYPDVNIRGYGHHDLAFLINGVYPDWATPQNRSLEDLLQDLLHETGAADRITLSSENFYLYPHPKKTMEILRDAGFPKEAVKIIVYLRRQDDINISWYNQAVKAQGYEGSIEDCIRETHDLWDYENRLKIWADAFGAENIVVRPYEPEKMINDDIRSDFLHLADIPSEHFNWPGSSTNTRINRDILEFQRLINRLPLTVQEKRKFHKELIALTASAAHLNLFDDTPLLTADQRKEILLSYAASNANVAKKYLGRNVLFNNNIPDDASASETVSGLTLEKLTYILGWILSKKE